MYVLGQWETTLQCNIIACGLSAVVLNLFSATQKYIFIFSHFWHRLLKSFIMVDKDILMLHSLYHCCWSPGNKRCQGISSHHKECLRIADNIFIFIYLNENCCILNEIFLKFVPRVQLTISHYWVSSCLGAKHAMTWTNDGKVLWGYMVSLGHNELNVGIIST